MLCIWKGGYSLKHETTPVNNVLFALCIWKGGGGYSLKHKITPVNNTAFVLCIWKGEGCSPKHQIIPINNVLFVLYIWKGEYSLKHKIPQQIISHLHFAFRKGERWVFSKTKNNSSK